MQAEVILQHLATVRGQLDRVCERLTSPTPEALDGCSGELESAVRQLAEWQPHLGAQAGNPAALEEAWRVRQSFLRARSLMRGAATFHGNWMRIRGSMSAGYTAQGEPGPLGHASRVCLQA
jgi:hypothetical protein